MKWRSPGEELPDRNPHYQPIPVLGAYIGVDDGKAKPRYVVLRFSGDQYQQTWERFRTDKREWDYAEAPDFWTLIQGPLRG